MNLNNDNLNNDNNSAGGNVWGRRAAVAAASVEREDDIREENAGEVQVTQQRVPQGQGRVKAVLSGDSFVVWVQNPKGIPEEVQITLSLLSAPRIARGKDAGTDQPWAWHSREALRKLLLAKNVQYRIDYQHPTSGRQYAFVKTTDGVNVNLAVAASGWARVQEPKAGKGPRGPEHVAMLEASQRASDQHIGIFNDDAGAAQRSVRDVKEKFDSWALFEDIRERLPVHGVVEGVLDGTTVRVLLVPSFYSVVVRLAGVQSPIWTRGGAPDKGDVGPDGQRTAQPFAEQAKYLTEYCLLGRDVAVHVAGVNKDDTFYGTVLFGGKNVADELLKSGYARFVQWSCPEADAGRFQQLEQQAQAKAVGVHKGQQKGAQAKDFEATVLDVRSGSRLTVEDASLRSYDVFFSSVIAPKLNPKNPKEDEACGYEAREFLRKKLIGKKVRVALDYEKLAMRSEDGSQQQPGEQSRKFYSVYLQGKHVPLMMVEQGLGQVITHRREEPRSREYSQLMAAEEQAKKSKKGVWDEAHPVKRLVDQSGMRAAQAKQYLKFVQKQGEGGLETIVEFVMNPVRLKLFVPELSSCISFTVSGIRAPWQDDEFGEAAALWARRQFHQRKLEVVVTGVDKGGNFIGDAFVRKQNVALTLLEEGWASVSSAADRHPLLAQYQKAEQGAQQQRKGIWVNWVPPSAEDLNKAAEEPEQPAETCKLLLTDIVDGTTFFCQRVSERDQTQLDQLMRELQRINGGPGAAAAATSAKYEKGHIACVRYAEDGLWYRVRLLDREKNRWNIHYIDFGNGEWREERDLRPVPPALQTIPPQALKCSLALLRIPSFSQDCGHEAAQALKELTWGKVLMASIEWREGDVHLVTLGDPQGQLNINKEMVRCGLATVKKPAGFGAQRRYEKPLSQLHVSMEEARSARMALWRYGDILDAHSDDEDQ